jgi:hypothetical protein
MLMEAFGRALADTNRVCWHQDRTGRVPRARRCDQLDDTSVGFGGAAGLAARASGGLRAGRRRGSHIPAGTATTAVVPVVRSRQHLRRSTGQTRYFLVAYRPVPVALESARRRVWSRSCRSEIRRRVRAAPADRGRPLRLRPPATHHAECCLETTMADVDRGSAGKSVVMMIDRVGPRSRYA